MLQLAEEASTSKARVRLASLSCFSAGLIAALSSLVAPYASAGAKVYETLFVAEVEDFLDDNEEDPFDLITATDVLPYLGALEPLFFGAAENMNPGGIFIFSSETLPEKLAEGRPYMVGPHQRFIHSEAYIRERLAATGFELLEIMEINVRMQEGQPSPGHLVTARYNG